MTIKDLADKLQKKIDNELVKFKDTYSKLVELNKEVLKTVENLEPVEYMIFAQNPEIEQIFNEVKKLKENYGTNEKQSKD